jgi:hypothetical protein
MSSTSKTFAADRPKMLKLEMPRRCRSGGVISAVTPRATRRSFRMVLTLDSLYAQEARISQHREKGKCKKKIGAITEENEIRNGQFREVEIFRLTQKPIPATL